METIKQGTDILGNRTKAKVVKNKVAPPFKEGEFDLLYGEGISQAGCILDMAVDQNIINKSGAWFSYGENRIGQGRDNAREFLKKDPALLAEIERKVRLGVGLIRAESEVNANSAKNDPGKAVAGKTK